MKKKHVHPRSTSYTEEIDTKCTERVVVVMPKYLKEALSEKVRSMQRRGWKGSLSSFIRETVHQRLIEYPTFNIRIFSIRS